VHWNGTDFGLPIYFIYANFANYYVDNGDFVSAKKYYIKSKKIVDTNMELAKDSLNIHTRKCERVVMMSIEADFCIAENKYIEAIDI